jgi:hypothetical protein
MNREEGQLMISEESRTAEQRRRKADDNWRVEQLNWEDGKLMECEESRTAEQWRRKADDEWREEDSWTEKKESW